MFKKLTFFARWCCVKTNLHGFRYVVNKTLSVITRIFFASICCCACILCIYLIALKLLELKQHTTITRIQTTTYPLWQFRFPAVTVCNFNVVYKKRTQRFYDIAAAHGIKKEIMEDYLKKLSSLVVFTTVDFTSNHRAVQRVLEEHGYDVDKTMLELAQPCKKLFKKCFWQEKQIDCSNIIQRVKTTQGYCCSFNYNGTHEVAEKIKEMENKISTYVGSPGPAFGLRVILDVEEKDYVSSIRPSQGVSVLVHAIVDYPNMHLRPNTLLKAEELQLSLTPTVYTNTERITKLSPAERGCLLEHEGRLAWSALYSFRTCIFECRARAILYVCNCIPYYYYFRSLGEARICTLFDSKCLRDNSSNYTALHVSGSFTDDEYEISAVKSINHVQCTCLPQCRERILSVDKTRKNAVQMVGYEQSNLSTLRVYYANNNCIQFERDVYLTWNYILAAIGGTFSLCLGGSIISIVECIYFIGKSISSYCMQQKKEEVAEVRQMYFATYVIKRQYNENPGKKAQNTNCGKGRVFVKAFGSQEHK